MLVATFGPSTAWQGREIIWDVDHFILVGHGAIPAAGVLDYDRRGQLVWAQPRVPRLGGRGGPLGDGRAARLRAPGAAGFGGASGAATSGGAAAGAAPARRFPTWAIVVLVVVGVLLVLSIIVAVRCRRSSSRTAETLTNDFVVRVGRAVHPDRHRDRTRPSTAARIRRPER